MGGNIHVLVNCAGIQRRSPSVSFPESDWDDVCYLCILSAVRFRILSYLI